MIRLGKREFLKRAVQMAGAALVAGAFIGMAPAGSAAVEPAKAQDFVRSAADELLALIKSPGDLAAKQAGFRTLIERYVAVRDVARLALGRDWNAINDAQRDRYVEAFLSYLSTTYARRFADYGGEKLELIDATDAGRKGVMVKSRITGRADGGDPIDVDWRIMDRNGPMQLFDIYVEGASLLITQQSEFSQFLDQHGGDVEKLIENLEAKTQLAQAPSR